jgi:phosphate/sulfate permease
MVVWTDLCVAPKERRPLLINLIVAWFLTLPASGGVAAASYVVFRALGLD